MEVTRYICSVCERETKEIKDRYNLRSYTEKVVTVRCPRHPRTPEERLLEAMFGGKKAS